MSDQNPFADLLETPRLYPWRLDLDQRRVVFVAMSPEAYRQSRFLDHRIGGFSGPAYDVSLDKLLDRFARAEAPPPAIAAGYVFHIGYCGSTLISRCLEGLGETLVLREPDPLRTLSTAQTERSEAVGPLLAVFARLWNRRWRADQVSIVKATSTCNNLMAPLMGLDPASRGVFVYTSLRDFLLATARDPARLGEAQFKLSRISALLPALFGPAAAPPDPESLGPLQTVALVWWAYRAIHDAVASDPHVGHRLPSLDFGHFLDHPRESLATLADHFGLDSGSQAIGDVLNGPLFSTYAKSGAPTGAFGRTDRARDLQRSYRDRADAVDATLEWAADSLPSLPEPTGDIGRASG